MTRHVVTPLLLLLALAGCASTSDTGTTTTPANRPSVTMPPNLPPLVTRPPPAGPMPFFSEGTHVVGADIEPGTYRTQGPSTDDGLCYWARLKDTTGDPDALITNGGGRGPDTVTVKDTDGAIRTSGCLPWAKTG